MTTLPVIWQSDFNQVLIPQVGGEKKITGTLQPSYRTLGMVYICRQSDDRLKETLVFYFIAVVRLRFLPQGPWLEPGFLISKELQETQTPQAPYTKDLSP